jgi:hypothetical protein
MAARISLTARSIRSVSTLKTSSAHAGAHGTRAAH